MTSETGLPTGTITFLFTDIESLVEEGRSMGVDEGLAYAREAS